MRPPSISTMKDARHLALSIRVRMKSRLRRTSRSRRRMVSRHAQLAQAVTYTIVVTNLGPNAVTGAPVTDTFPASLTGAIPGPAPQPLVQAVQQAALAITAPAQSPCSVGGSATLYSQCHSLRQCNRIGKQHSFCCRTSWSDRPEHGQQQRH